jgi:large subunit ribosomal protein L25
VHGVRQRLARSNKFFQRPGKHAGALSGFSAYRQGDVCLFRRPLVAGAFTTQDCGLVYFWSFKMKVIAFTRTLQGTGASRRLRIAGQTPGIIYGGTSAPVNITLDHNALYHALKKEVFHSSILDMEIDGVSQPVLLRDFQVHAFKQLVLHADFQRIDANQKIKMKVALHFANADVSPAVKLHGATISHVMTEIEVLCLPGDLPEFITVDLTEVDVGHSIHMENLVLPTGVTVVMHGTKQTVATALVPAGHISAEAAAPADAAAPAAKGKSSAKK